MPLSIMAAVIGWLLANGNAIRANASHGESAHAGHAGSPLQMFVTGAGAGRVQIAATS